MHHFYVLNGGSMVEAVIVSYTCHVSEQSIKCNAYPLVTLITIIISWNCLKICLDIRLVIST
uniref:Uncharacterized protein LOC105138806 n=1 Tax=Rhizophora mucronata TaxID=61149 RepID=A0A2P2P498_RHIMU